MLGKWLVLNVAPRFKSAYLGITQLSDNESGSGDDREHDMIATTPHKTSEYVSGKYDSQRVTNLCDLRCKECLHVSTVITTLYPSAGQDSYTQRHYC